MVYGMHPFPAFGSSKPSGYSEQYSGAELIRRTVATSGLPHTFLTNVQNFQSSFNSALAIATSSAWVLAGLLMGAASSGTVLPQVAVSADQCRGDDVSKYD